MGIVAKMTHDRLRIGRLMQLQLVIHKFRLIDKVPLAYVKWFCSNRLSLDLNELAYNPFRRLKTPTIISKSTIATPPMIGQIRAAASDV